MNYNSKTKGKAPGKVTLPGELFKFGGTNLTRAIHNLILKIETLNKSLKNGKSA